MRFAEFVLTSVYRSKFGNNLYLYSLLAKL